MARVLPWRSLAFRLALSYGCMLVFTVAVVLAVFYLQIVGVLRNRLDQYATTQLKRLQDYAAMHGVSALHEQIDHLMRDGINTDTEIILLLTPEGHTIIGNADIVPARRLTQLGMRELTVQRMGRNVVGRVQAVLLPDGNYLVVGSDMRTQVSIEDLFARASSLVVLVALLMAVVGAISFRRLVDARALGIRSTMARVAAGDLAQRIPVQSQEKDEFALLSRDINSMLERLQQVMDGVRHVSNTIAHNLRTPMTRILLRLRAAEQAPEADQRATLRLVAEEVAELGVVFDKLLAIAEVESGALRQAFAAVDVAALLLELHELYEPVVQEEGGSMALQLPGDPSDGLHGPCVALGDTNLLASALANVVENAIKYGARDGVGPRIVLQARCLAAAGDAAACVEILVQDDGLGVAEADLAQLSQRFFRAQQQQPGTGLGLASVQAVVRLHGGQLQFRNTEPGFAVQILLPVAMPPTHSAL
ncbi:HAMP domain-containing sensor histidine kinase [Comamonas sp.]|uniref:sensor histidine kinase n=1 Tax=Comamonas sp. TaxID=34028 RepID=UPI00289CE8B2|nr:HAMP domain-containing sensor histidine kinase [Comamonas sp.]